MVGDRAEFLCGVTGPDVAGLDHSSGLNIGAGTDDGAALDHYAISYFAAHADDTVVADRACPHAHIVADGDAAPDVD